MGFLSWLAGREKSTDSQLNLFGDSQPLTQHERVDGAIVNKDLNKEIKAKGGSEAAYPRVAETITEEMFDMSSRELYKATGGKINRRETLPKEAQQAFIAAELRVTHDLKSSEIHTTDQNEIDTQIDETARVGSRETRNWWSLW